MPQRKKIYDITICAMFTAILCICSATTIPIGPIPISLGIFGILLVSNILSLKRALLSTFIFIFLGIIGLPVFSGFKGGIFVIIGPTGGYIISYLLVSLITNISYQRLSFTKIPDFIKVFISSIVGIFICYFFGTLHYMIALSIPCSSAILTCIIPFIPFDILKALAVSFISLPIKNAIKSINNLAL